MVEYSQHLRFNFFSKRVHRKKIETQSKLAE